MFRYEKNIMDPVTGQRYVQPEFQIPIDAYHVIGRMEEYIQAFNRGLEALRSGQAEISAAVQRLSTDQSRLEVQCSTLQRKVADLMEHYRSLQEDRPIPAHRCPGCEEVKTLDSFSDGDYLCGDCRG